MTEYWILLGLFAFHALVIVALLSRLDIKLSVLEAKVKSLEDVVQ